MIAPILFHAINSYMRQLLDSPQARLAYRRAIPVPKTVCSPATAPVSSPCLHGSVANRGPWALAGAAAPPLPYRGHRPAAAARLAFRR